ncbi:MAG TPA: hypothetical protein VGK15_07135 [Candidatus Limnocylindria bacterium]|jgi:hypothetical protein
MVFAVRPAKMTWSRDWCSLEVGGEVITVVIRRVAQTAALSLMLLLMPHAAAYGSVQWCSEDPILTFSNGAKLQLVGWYDSAYARTVTGPVIWSIQVPANAGTVLVTIPSNAAHREQVTLRYTGGKWDGRSDVQVHASVTVNAPGRKFTVLAGAYGDTSTSPKSGEANKTITLAAHTHAGAFTAYQGVTEGVTFVFVTTATVTN